ncbi:MAG: hypothetical protein P8Y13_14090, partial [Deinococcales bacterium]
MTSRKVLLALVLMIVGSLVFAQALPDQSTLTLTTSDGTLVGSGTYVGGNLTVDVLTGYSGDATLTVTTRGGDTLTYDVTVNPDGSVSLTSSSEPLQDINPSVKARGGTITFDQVDTVTAPTLPSAAPGPDSHANANASEGAANATEGMGNAAAASSTGADHANSHASGGSG